MNDAQKNSPLDVQIETPHLEDKKTTKGNYWLYTCLIAMISLIAFITAFAYYAYNKLFKEVDLKKLIKDKASQAIGLPVQIENVRLAFPTIVASGIEVGTPASHPLPWARIETMAVSPDFFELISGNIEFDSFEVASVTIALVKDASEGIILGPIYPKNSNTKSENIANSPTPAIPAGNFRVTSLYITIDDKATNRIWNVTSPNIEFSRSKSVEHALLKFKTQIKNIAEVEFNGNVHLSGKLEGKTKVSGVELKNISTALASFPNLLKNLGTPELNLSFYFDSSGKLDIKEFELKADNNFRIKGGFNGTNIRPLNGQLSFHSDPIDLTKAFAIATDFLQPDQAKKAIIDSGTVTANGKIVILNGYPETLDVICKPTKVKGKIPEIVSPIEITTGEVTLKSKEIILSNLVGSIGNAKFSSSKGLFSFTNGFSGTSNISFSGNLKKTLDDLKNLIPKEILNYKVDGDIAFNGKLNLSGLNSSVDGELSLRNFTILPPQTGFLIKASEVNAFLDRLSLNSGSIKIEKLIGETLACRINAKGIIKTPITPEFDINGEGETELEKLHRELPIENENFKRKTTLGGNLKVSFKLRGNLKKPELEAESVLKDGKFIMPEKGLDIKNIFSKIQASLNKLNIVNLEAITAGAKISGSGTIVDFKNPILDLKCSVAGVDLVQIKKILLINVPSFPKTLDFSGKANMITKVRGSAIQPKIIGNADLFDVNFFHPSLMRPLEKIAGPIEFDNDTISTKGLKVSWGSSTANIKGKVHDLSSFKLLFDYEVDPLDVTDIGNFFLAKTGYVVTGKGRGKGVVTGPIDSFILEGNANIPSGEFAAPISEKNRSLFRFPFSNLAATVTFTKGILDITKASFDLFKGKVDSKGRIYVTETPIKFEFDVKGASLETQEFLALNTTQKKVLSGGLNLNLKVNGKTTGLESINGNASIGMKKGKYQSPPVLSNILTLLKAENLASGDIENVGGNFLIQNGRMTSNDLIFQSPYGEMGYKGWVGLDTSLDGTVFLRIKSAVCQGNQTLRQLAGGQGKDLVANIGVKGTLLSPKPDLNVNKMLEDAVQRNLKSTAEKLLTDSISNIQKEITGKIASGTASEAQQIPLSPEKKIKNELKKLEKGLKKLFR